MSVKDGPIEYRDLVILWMIVFLNTFVTFAKYILVLKYLATFAFLKSFKILSI